MWPWILGSAGIGSVLGGIQGYQSSGGDLGETLKGAATGGLMGGITGGIGSGAQRMAGSAMEAALAGSGPAARAASTIAPDVYKAGEALKAVRAGAGIRGAQQAAAQAGLAAPLAQQAAGLNILGKVLPSAAGLTAGLVAPAVALPVIGAGARLAGQAAGGAARAAGLPVQTAAGYLGSRPYETDYAAKMASYDPEVLRQIQAMQYGANPLEIIGPRGMTRTLETQREARAQADAARILGTEEAKFMNVAKQKDLERSLAAAAVRSNIATQAAMLQQSQLGAQDLASRAMQGISSGLTQQYQYS